MGGYIGKRRGPSVHRCECSLTQPGTMRAVVFRTLEGSVTDPEPWKQHSISIFFISIFELENTKCNSTCSDLRIRSENITEEELLEIQIYLRHFIELVTSFPDIFYEPFARKVLSGIVLFRIEFLHLFRDAINDDSDVTPLLLRLLHWEDKIRKRLTKHPREDSGLHYIGTSYFSDSITNAHKWWQPKFIESMELNVAEEYDLTD